MDFVCHPRHILGMICQSRPNEVIDHGHRLKRRLSVLVPFLLLVLAAPLYPQSLPPAIFDLTCNQYISTTADPHAFGCRDQGPLSSGHGTFERRSISHDHVGAPLAPNYLSQEIRDLLVGQLGGQPYVFLATVATSATINLVSNPAGVERAVGSGAIAAMDFHARVDQIATPPIPTPNVPVAVRMYGEARLQGRSSVTMKLIAGGEVFEFTRSNGDEPGTVGDAVTHTIQSEQKFFVLWSIDIAIDKSTQCSVHAVRITPGSTTASCEAAWDPLLTLDQEAFDLLMGANSYPLDQYFRIAYSPNMPLDALFRDSFEIGDTSAWSSWSN